MNQRPPQPHQLDDVTEALVSIMLHRILEQTRRACALSAANHRTLCDILAVMKRANGGR